MKRAIALAALGLTFAGAAPAAAAAAPPVGHVFVVVLENKNYVETFGPNTEAPYFAGELAKRGQLLTQYHGIGHLSLDNYLAMISGQGPNPQTQSDCQRFIDFTGLPDLDADGQAIGQGCVYPAKVKTLADQLSARGLRWKGYMQDMGSPCRHPSIGAADDTQRAKVGDQYAARHNPFVYFHSIIDSPDCARNDVPLDALPDDLATVESTPSLSFIVPNLCEDGHDAPCVDGRPGGLVSADAWLRTWIPKILGSPAFQRDGMLVVTFDEAEAEPPEADASACCDEPIGPNTPNNGGPVPGPGGGRIGAVVVSPFVEPGSMNPTAYNHYSLLRTLEDLFGVGHLGFAARPGLRAFGDDVFARASTPADPGAVPGSSKSTCTAAADPVFARAGARGRRSALRVRLALRGPNAAVVQLQRGGRVVARHRPARRTFTWRPRIRDGIYVLRLAVARPDARPAVRRVGVTRRRGRFAGLGAFSGRLACGPLASASLRGPSLGRTTSVRYTLRSPSPARLVLMQGSRRVRSRRLPGTAGAHHVTLVGLPRGHLRLVISAGRSRITLRGVARR